MRHELASLFSEEIAILSVDDMAKIKVGAPAVSRYHQIKRFFLENDRLNLSDHDFPVPGYLLNVSGYMFLESNDFFEGNVNNDPKPVTFYHSQNNKDPDFSQMVIEDFNDNFFNIIRRQAEHHLNIQVSEKECMDALKNDVNVDSLKEEISLASFNDTLAAVANLFKCRVIVFYKHDGEVIFNGINPQSSTIEPPIYLFRERKKFELFF